MNMWGRKTLVVLIALGVFAFVAVKPPRAQAVDIEKTLIISGATAGAVALIALIAILASEDDDLPDFLTDAPRRTETYDRGIRFGFPDLRTCPVVGGNISIACW